MRYITHKSATVPCWSPELFSVNIRQSTHFLDSTAQREIFAFAVLISTNRVKHLSFELTLSAIMSPSTRKLGNPVSIFGLLLLGCFQFADVLFLLQHVSEISFQLFVCLFGLRLNVPVNIFSVMLGQSQRFLCLTSTVGSKCVLLKETTRCRL